MNLKNNSGSPCLHPRPWFSALCYFSLLIYKPSNCGRLFHALFRIVITNAHIYQQGIDDFYQSQAESQKKKLDTIHEYLLYIMSPFVYEEDMDEFCTDLLRFAMDHSYRPEVEWKRFKTKLSSFDVRHLVWSIATRLGLGKGKVYSNDDCACYIERRFASLCVTGSGEPLSHSTLRNLTVTSNSDQIHCDIQGADGLLFHIPSQLGIEKD